MSSQCRDSYHGTGLIDKWHEIINYFNSNFGKNLTLIEDYMFLLNKYDGLSVKEKLEIKNGLA